MIAIKIHKHTSRQETNAAIVERVQAGDADALQDLCETNKRLVGYFANRYLSYVEQRKDLDFDDLMQAGCLGMCLAAAKYDPGRGASFATFAADYIRGCVKTQQKPL